MAFGVLGGSCDADRASALHRGGVRLVELGVEWGRFEPEPGRYDEAYANDLRTRIARCSAAGLDLVLTPGFQYAPRWVAALPGGAYRSQSGREGPATVPNLVFSARVRQAATAYVGQLAAELGPARFVAVRVGTSESGELGYPGRQFGAPNPDNAMWAFDAAAQSGTDLAAGMTTTPLPGWQPGDPTWRGQGITTDHVRAWFTWYTASVARTVAWEVETLRAAGFHGAFHVPLAGRGILPADLTGTIRSRLDGTVDRDGSLERGLYYPDQLAAIAAAVGTGDLVADVTGLDDATAVAARMLTPPQDDCLPNDADVVLDPATDVARWSASRWTIANARRLTLRLVGENPGSPTVAGNGGDDLSDPLAAQLVHAPDYARDCGLESFFWAFEDDLFAPKPEVSMSDLAKRTAR